MLASLNSPTVFTLPVAPDRRLALPAGAGRSAWQRHTRAHVQVAQACGCLVVSDVSVPTVQAGERILFAADSGTVTAIIQVQYQANQAISAGWCPCRRFPKSRRSRRHRCQHGRVFSKLLATTSPSCTINQINLCAAQFTGGFGRAGSGGGCSSRSFGGCNSNGVRLRRTEQRGRRRDADHDRGADSSGVTVVRGAL